MLEALLFLTFSYIAFVYIGLKNTKWLKLNKKYPVSNNKLKELRKKFCFDNANINGLYYYNYLYSYINRDGIFIKHLFPFSLIMRPVFIPWNHVSGIKFVHSVQNNKNFLTKLLQKFSLNKYIKIYLCDFQEDYFFIIRWKPAYEGCLPEKMQPDSC